MHFSIGIFMLFSERLSYFSCLGPVIIIFLIFRTSGFFWKMDDSCLPDPIVEAGPSNDPAAGSNESLITLGKRAAESEASNDSANDEVSQKCAFFGLFLSPFGAPRTEKPFLRHRASPSSPQFSVFLLCPEDYGSYGVFLSKCCRCVPIIWVLISSRASTRLKNQTFQNGICKLK